MSASLRNKQHCRIEKVLNLNVSDCTPNVLLVRTNNSSIDTTSSLMI